MNQQKLHRLRRYGICLVILCLCACVVLSIGVTYARYRTDYLTESYYFTTYMPQSYRLHGEVTDEWKAEVQNGNWPEFATGWTLLENAQTDTGSETGADTGTDAEAEATVQADAELRFSVSNGESGMQYSRRDQAVTIQLVASLTIEAPEKLTVTLTGPDPLYPNKQIQYIAVPQQIQEGSFLYEIYGDGWVYRFYPEDSKEEISFSLAGRRLSYTNFVIGVAGDVAPSLLSLEITTRYME